jgi:hypothetical protein
LTFVAAPPANPPAAVLDAIAGDGWYPDLSIQAFRASQRVPEVVTPARARDALIGGYLTAETNLATWRAAQQAAGKASLETTDARTLGGESRAVQLWRRAVHAFAAADLAETHGDISATEAGRDRTEVRAQSAGDLRRNGTAAIRDIIGTARNRSRLI